MRLRHCTGCGRDRDDNRFYHRGNGHVIQPCIECVAKRDRKLTPTKAREHCDRVKDYYHRRGGKAVRDAWRQRPQARIAHSLRQRVRELIQGAKPAKTLALVGCDARFLMGYLEARFQRGMKWSNYGTVWEIDHRIPCASYDLTDPSHQRSCFHYSNLQPLFCPGNRAKSAKMPPPHQAELL